MGIPGSLEHQQSPSVHPTPLPASCTLLPAPRVSCSLAGPAWCSPANRGTHHTLISRAPHAHRTHSPRIPSTRHTGCDPWYRSSCRRGAPHLPHSCPFPPGAGSRDMHHSHPSGWEKSELFPSRAVPGASCWPIVSDWRLWVVGIVSGTPCLSSLRPCVVLFIISPFT